MTTRRIEELLRALPARLIERPRAGLAGEIKSRIPYRFSPHRLDTISIIIDLRISRVVAAAVILLAVFLIGSFFGGRNAIGRDVYEDGKLFLKYALHGDDACKAEVLQGLARFHDDMVAQGRDVVFYGDCANLSDPHAILMHWVISEDKYGVILGDLSARTVTARTLIRLQAHMVQEPSGK